MTRKEAINKLQTIKADNLNIDVLYVKDNYDALVMAQKSLEAWNKVIEEINEKSKIGGVIYTQDVRDIINKHLGEIEK